MKNNNSYDYEAAKAIIFDDTNVTETNILKDLFQICIKFVLILICIYLFIFISSGIIIENMSVKTQIKLENFLANTVKVSEFKAANNDLNRLAKIKNRIKSEDNKYPKTSNLNIRIIEAPYKNAFCLPNGNIYITEELYKELKDDEMLTFVIAHEMAHYKHKDHIMTLRKNIASKSIVLIASVISSNKDISNVIENSISLTDLKHSRKAEKEADKYAATILNKIYGNTSGGIRALEILAKDEDFNLEFLSTHPQTKERIKRLRKP